MSQNNFDLIAKIFLTSLNSIPSSLQEKKIVELFKFLVYFFKTNTWELSFASIQVILGTQ